MEKIVRVSEKLVSPGLPGLQVATRLIIIIKKEIKTNGSELKERHVCENNISVIYY